jgi:predicted lipoprotein with Yx(FWY)xxD motif
MLPTRVSTRSTSRLSHRLSARLSARRTTYRQAGVIAAGCLTVAAATMFSTSALAQTSPATTAPATTVKASTLAIRVQDSKLGPVLADASGLTLYMYSPDRYNVSVCEGQCLAAWPPFMLPKGKTLSDIEIPSSLRRSKLGVAMRENGTAQVTYDGWALYTWVRDSKAGDVTGQAVGNIWWVFTEDGRISSAR